MAGPPPQTYSYESRTNRQRTPFLGWQQMSQHPDLYFNNYQYNQPCPPHMHFEQNQYQSMCHPNFNGNQSQPRFNNYRNNNNKPFNKKQKEPNFIDFCETCDRGFKTQEKKTQHYAEHVKCDEKGCKFEAHFKLMIIHKRNQHGPNGYKINVSTPEEILKWREERRKKFPTASRIKIKHEELEMQEKQGAVLQQQSFGKFKGGKRGYANKRRLNNTTNHSNEDRKCEEITSVKVDDQGSSSPKEMHDSKSDGNLLNKNGLNLLMTNYDASDSEADEPNNKIVKPDNNISKDGVDNISTQILEQQKKVNGGGKYKKRNKSRHEKNNNKLKNSKRIRPSLLRMLLEPEIQDERNNILQCTRYIVENNFFDDEKNKN